MKYQVLLACVLSFAAGVLMVAQQPGQRLPNGKLWADVINRADYEDNLEDASELADLSAEIRDELKDGSWYVLSLDTLKKVKHAEDLAKNLRERMEKN